VRFTPSTPAVVLASALWLGLTGAVLLRSAARDATPGEAGVAPARWPETTRLPRRAGASTLVLALHPACPCSQASLDELEGVLARATAPITAPIMAIVLVVRPAGLEAPAAEAAALERVRAIPGALAIVDEGGVEARRLGARTSGHVLVFDGEGRLTYTGGITAGRGLRGDGAARQAVAAALDSASTPTPSCPVYGCPLEGRRTS
jgi:hypothetical protein